MSNEALTGVWIYRSFYNVTEYVGDDFNKIALAEAELTFEKYSEPNELRGQMAFRTTPEPLPTDARLTVFGSVTPGTPTTIHILGRGVPGTEADGWQYEQTGYLVPSWPSGVDQVPAIVGMVTRRVPHGDGHGGTRPAGFVGSFIAVKRTTPEPRDVIPLDPHVLAMLASREHRLHHSVWHSVRNMWPFLSDAKKDAIRKLNWQPGEHGRERPAAKNRIPFTQNGSGEDFLFMHRKMIGMVRDHLVGMGKEVIKSWEMIPPPGPVTVEPDYGHKPVKLPPPGNPDGFAVMPNWAEPDMEDDARRQGALKSDDYYWSSMFPVSQRFQDPNHLGTLSLGALGGLIEWTIHNDMHMRWTSEPRDPATGKAVPSGRDALDLDPKWDGPIYDSLSEPYSSLVNPVFWRLHGWIDDRIDDWFAAHEAIHPGELTRRKLDGVNWFNPGKWVLLDTPWDRPRASGEALDIKVMEEVNRIVWTPDTVLRGALVSGGVKAGPRVQWFGRQ
jgi:hypothetical protein